MMPPLLLTGTGAVTAVGLTARQTCVAIRARLAGFREALFQPPPNGPVLTAPVPASLRLKTTPFEWLANLAARALRECLAQRSVEARATPLLIAFPDAIREHAAMRTGAASLFNGIADRMKLTFHPASATFESGRAGVAAALATARTLLDRGTAAQCIVGGVDSLVNRADVDRLSDTGRLHAPDNPQGLIPGEGAGFLLVSRLPADASAQLAGIGIGREADSALGPRFAIGRGLQDALIAALEDAGGTEADIAFRVSDMNGERYHAWDSVLAAGRFYRTRRERLPVWYPAAYVGDTGAAAGALDVIFAAHAISNGFAPGPIGMCEASSDDGLRAACLVCPAPGRPLPPFHPE